MTSSGEAFVRMHCGPVRLVYWRLAVIFFVASYIDISASVAAPVVGSVFRDCVGRCPEMVVVPSGQFQMGLTEDEIGRFRLSTGEQSASVPQHLVTIRHPFALGKYNVTREEFSIFTKDTGYTPDRACLGADTSAPMVNWQTPGFLQTLRDPVVCVSWVDANAYVSWLSHKTGKHYRLPSEAEWEYAARAGVVEARNWNEQPANVCRYANVKDISFFSLRRIQARPGRSFECNDGFPYTSPVGSFLPNQFGLYDMLGNVFQLTQDCWHQDYRGAPTDDIPWASAECNTHIVRGASFETYPKFVRFTERGFIPLTTQSLDTGFRVARDL